jgi:hypothetical protein
MNNQLEITEVNQSALTQPHNVVGRTSETTVDTTRFDADHVHDPADAPSQAVGDEYDTRRK